MRGPRGAPCQSCDIGVYCGSDGSCLAIRLSTLRACSAGTASCGKTGKSRTLGEVRCDFIEAAVLEQGYQASEGASFLGCHASNVNCALQKRQGKPNFEQESQVWHQPSRKPDSRGGAENAEKEIMKELDDITGAVVDAAMKIHMDLGPGLLESVYEAVLARALERRGLQVERQKVIRFEYDGMVFDEGFRTDLLVEGRVVVELKSVEKLAPVHSKQLLTYLRLMNLPVGLLINFGSATLKEGLHRIVNKLPSSASPRLRVNQSGAEP